MPIGYVPFSPTDLCQEARWLAEALTCEVVVCDPDEVPLACEAIVLEGVTGFRHAAALRSRGYRGRLDILPYLNPASWEDILSVAAYTKVAEHTDRVFVGSGPSAGILAALGVRARVAEPYGIDDDVFTVCGEAEDPPILLYAGRLQPDKDVQRLLGMAVRARLLVPGLRIVLASHIIDPPVASALSLLDAPIQLVREPSRKELAALYSSASVFVTASTSHFETFGRAPAEAMACGTPAIAPCYDGFAEVLDQVGGHTVPTVTGDGGSLAVNQTLLLRTVYDVLTGPRPPRHEISATARRRFGRAHTIRCFTDPPPPYRGPPARLSVPRTAGQAAGFADDVRRALCR